MSRENYKRLGKYIRPVNIRNTELKVKTLLGVSIKKILMPSIANTVGTNMKTYKIIKRNQFAYGPVTSRNGDKISVALLQDYDEAIVSQAYTVFEVNNENELHPEYLMMWMRRPEFDRYARFKSHGSAREIFDWDTMCEVELPIPTIEKQLEIVKEYNTIVNRIKLNEQLNQKLEETAQALYKHWFVDFEFHCLPENYKFSGAVKPDDFETIMTYKRVGGLPVPDGKSWFIYVLVCEGSSAPEGKTETFYKGMTNDLYRRFYEHYTEQGAEWTKVHKPKRIIHWEQFGTQEQATKREKELKTGYGRTWLKREYEKLIKNSGGLPAHQSRLMQAGKMVWNDKLGKEIPEGWDVDSLKNKCSKIGSGSTPRGGKDAYKESGISLIRSMNVHDFMFVMKDLAFIDEQQAKKLKTVEVIRNDILLNITGASVARCTKVPKTILPARVNQHVAIIRMDDINTSNYVLCALCSTFYKKKLIGVSESGSTREAITKEDIENFDLLFPDKILLEGFNKKLEVIFQYQGQRNLENESLYLMRDLLLSKMTKVETEKELV